jgi:hypothetical protein
MESRKTMGEGGQGRDVSRKKRDVEGLVSEMAQSMGGQSRLKLSIKCQQRQQQHTGTVSLILVAETSIIYCLHDTSDTV